MSSTDYVICVRNLRKGKFGAEPGPTRFLEIPTGALPDPDQQTTSRKWCDAVVEESKHGTPEDPLNQEGDILIFVHGYNNPQDIVMQRHRRLKTDLATAGFKGTVVSFDWPSDDRSINYVEDRSDAKQTAFSLVKDGISELVKRQTPDCTINVHLLGHSTGAYVIREAFDDADDRPALASRSWTVSQTVFIGGDVSAGSMEAGDSKNSSLYRRSVRVTNYMSHFDSALKLSNVKRVGVAPRVGRAGLPDSAPSHAVNVDCSDYWSTLSENHADQNEAIGSFSHPWHIGNRHFAEDLALTLNGDTDRSRFPTRELIGHNRMKLRVPSN
jgi:esterase/lipase superfamily enzyme